MRPLAPLAAGAAILGFACACAPRSSAPTPVAASALSSASRDASCVGPGCDVPAVGKNGPEADPKGGVRLPQALPDEIQWQTAQPADVRPAEAVEVEVIAAEGRSVTLAAPFAGRLGRAELGWPRVGTALGSGDVAMRLLLEEPAARHTVSAPWRPRPIGGGGADLSVLELLPGRRWIEAVVVAPGARVPAGTPLLRVLGDDDLEVRLRLSAGDLQRLSDLKDADLLVPDTRHGPLVLTPRLDRMGDGATLRAPLPAGSAGPGGGWPGDRRAAFLRHGASERVLAVPRAASVRRGVESFVWRRDGSGAFWRTEVVFGRDGGDRLAVERGLEAGDQVVTEGHALIEAAWARHRGGAPAEAQP